MPETLEAICIEIKKPRIKPFLVSSWYRAPDLNVEIFDYFEIFLRKAEQENKDIIITGDLNCNFFSDEEITQTKKLKNVVHIRTANQDRVTANSHELLPSFDLGLKSVYKYIDVAQRGQFVGISSAAKESIAILLSVSAVQRKSL